MKSKVKILSLAYILFFAMLFISGCFSGLFSDIIYFVAYILPLFLALRLGSDDGWFNAEWFSIKKDGLKLSLIALMPTVAIIMGISMLTSFVIKSVTGAANGVDIGDSLVFALFYHAFLPAIFEEMLFRYLPMRLLSGYSKKYCVLLSAMFFSLIHHNFFSIPYAFVAGVVFMTLNLMCDSIIPGTVIHFLNNVISILLIFYGTGSIFAPICIGLVVLLGVISIAFVFPKRKEYFSMIKSVFWGGERIYYCAEMWVFIAICLIVSVVNLF